MAKTKSRKAQKKKSGLQSDVLVYIYALTAIAISVIGCLKIGFVGGLLTSVLQYLIGTLYGVFYGVVIGVSLMAIFRRSWKQLPAQYIVAIILFLSGFVRFFLRFKNRQGVISLFPIRHMKFEFRPCARRKHRAEHRHAKKSFQSCSPLSFIVHDSRPICK